MKNVARYGVVKMRVRSIGNHLSAYHAQELPVEIDQGTAGRTGVAGDGIDDQDVATIAEVSLAPTSVQAGSGREDAVNQGHRFGTFGDFESVARGEHPIAGAQLSLLSDIEEG